MFFVALHIHKNSLSASLEAACREEGRKEDAAEVSELIKVASLALEKEVCDIGAACGWLAATSESKLPCGDIDALLAIPVGDERVRLVVCEVKDADLLAHRENTFEIHEEFASKVRRQLKNKSEWLVRNWNKGFGVRLFGAEIGSRHTGDLVRVLITRDRVPLTTGAEFVLLSVGELRPFIAQLKCELPSWLLAGEPPKATCF